MAQLAVDAAKYRNCIRFSTNENILKLFSLFDAKSRKHILLSYFNKFKPPHQHNQIQKSTQDIKIFSRFSKIVERQLIKQNRQNSPTMCNISGELFANIISFCTMKERLICEQVSSKLYDICQMKQAKSHLAINKSFVRNALYDNIDIYKYYNIKYLSINFVYCNPIYKRNNENDFESKYYHIINEIMSHSPELKTIEYSLTENSFRSFLGQNKCSKNNAYNKQYAGGLYDFAYNLCTKSTNNNFGNINKLIWREKQYKDINWRPGGGKSINTVHKWLFHKQDVQNFVNIFKNVKSLVIPSDFNLLSYPLVSQIWSNKYYYKYLQHLHINLTQIIDNNDDDGDSGDDDDDDDDNLVVTEISHPFTILHKYLNLNSLYLSVPIFRDCMNYYNSLLTNDKIITTLMDIQIDFEINKNIQKQETLNIIDKIWLYLLSFCTNICNFKCIIHNESDIQLETKHSYISQLNNKYLESIYYECGANDIKKNMMPVLRKLNANNLRQLTLGINKIIDGDNIYEYLKKLKLKKFKALEAFKFICSEKCEYKKDNGFIECMLGNVIGFLQFINKQKYINNGLNFFKMIHKTYRDTNYQRRYRKYKTRKKQLNKIFVNVQQSEKICQLLTAITTKHKNIKIIELYPVGIRFEQLQFLHFWYSDNFGGLNVREWHQTRKTYLVDLKIRNICFDEEDNPYQCHKCSKIFKHIGHFNRHKTQKICEKS